MNKHETDFLIEEITRHLGAKRDGGNKNLIARCPYCGKEDKYGIYIGKETLRKKPFMAHCFSCGRSTLTRDKLLEEIGRPDLMITPTADLSAPLNANLLFPLDNEEEIDDTLGIVELPDFYRQVYTHPYLKARGFVYDDYEQFPVGITAGLNRRYDDYVIFPVIDSGDVVGYVARHTWSKEEIDKSSTNLFSPSIASTSISLTSAIVFLAICAISFFDIILLSIFTIPHDQCFLSHIV